VALGVATAIGASLLSAVPPVAAPARAAVRAQQKPVPVTSRANSITAMQAAVAQGSRVEDLSARTESAQTFANPDGSWTTESTFAPVRVQHADGSWADIDTTLVAGKDGTVAPRVGQPGVVFSGGGTSSGWQHLVGFGAGTAGSWWWWRGPLPAPVLSGSTATYPGVEPGVDLVLTATPAGFEQSLVFTVRPTGPVVIPLAVTTGKAVSTKVNADGSVTWTAQGGATATALGASMSDALTTPAGDPANVVTVPSQLLAAGATTTSLPIPVTSTTFPVTPATAGSPGSRATGPALPAASASPSSSGSAPMQAPVLGVGPSTVHGRGLPGSVTDVASVLGSLPSGARGWVLAPPAAVLSDPSTVFPVVVDPSVVMTTTFSTFVQSNLNTSQAGSSTVRLGNAYTLANPIPARGFYQFLTQPVAGATVSAATLQVYNSHSNTCAAKQWQVGLTGSINTSTVWANQPGWLSTWNILDTSRGFNSTCAAGWTSLNVQPLLQNIANNKYKWSTLGIRASNEGDPLAYKQFGSTNSPNPAKMTVTYNHTPNVPASVTVSPETGPDTQHLWVRSSAPVLGATVSDPDGGNVQGQFQILNAAGTTAIWSGNSAFAPSGSRVTVTVPAGVLTNGTAYQLRVRTSDGTAVSPWPATTFKFTIDTTAPATPSVSSTVFPSGGWATIGPGASGPFTVTDTAGDVTTWSASFDQGVTWTSYPGGPSSTLTLTPPPAGNVTLWVRAMDLAGNWSNNATYQFNVAAVTSPAQGAQSQKFLTLGAVAAPTATAVMFQYSTDHAVTWTTIPVAEVTVAGSGIGSWPVPTTISGGTASAPAGLVWDARASLGADAPVQLRAVFTGGTSPPTTVNNPTATIDSTAYGLSYASTDVGVGSVSLVTGNLAVTGSDASVAATGVGLGVSRTFNTLQPTLVPATGPAIFGPGWTTTLASQESDWAKLEDLGSAGVRLTDSDGGQWYFTKTGSTYTPVGDAATAAYTLTVSGTGLLTYTLTDTDGGTVTFQQVAAGGTPTLTTPKPYRVVSSQPAVIGSGPAQVSSFAYNSDGTPAALFAPPPPGVTCTPTTINIGCRELVFSYTGTGTNTRLTAVTFKTKDDTGTLISTDIACYTYDATNRLAAVWDPRLGGSAGWGTTCGSPVQATSYTYDSAGRIATVGTSGLAPVTVTYGGSGRFATVSRTHSATFGGGSLTTSVLYGVPIAATTATDGTHPDLSPARVGLWGQTDLPLTAAVVYSPGATVSGTDLRDGTVHATDANGREVNTASYAGTGQDGWRVDTNEFDSNGNPIRALTAGNRDRALNPGAYTDELTGLGLAGASSQQIAAALDTRTIYSDNGVDVTDSFGPAHLAVLPSGVVAVVRAHQHTDYGTTDYPTTTPTDWTTGGPLHSPVQQTETASLSLDPVATDDTDPSITRYAYGLSGTDHTGWDLRSAMATTVVNGTTNIVRQTRYDSNGNVIEQRQPSAAGVKADPGTRVSDYYQPGPNDPANCTSTEWYGQLCRTTPGAQPTTSGLPGLVSTTYTYDALLRPVTTTETVTPAGGGTSTRTSTTTYANGGASPQVTSVAVTGGIGTAVPASTTTYDPTTGLPLTVTAGGKTQTTTYDDFGQVTAYTDADGAKTLTTYDTAGRVATRTLTKTDGTTTLGTDTYGYNAGNEHRGNLTSVTDSSLGTITGTYDAAGSLTSQTLGSGLSQAFSTDATGATTSTTWADSAGNVFLSDTQVSDVHGQWASESGSGLPWSRQYGYDQAGRLTSVQETENGTCTTRTYTFDVNSNRTNSTSYPSDSAGACSSTTTPTSTQTLGYDNADRMLPTGAATGTAYDPWGRITTLPAALTATPTAGDTTIGYYVNDMARTLTQGGGTRTWTMDPAGRLAWLTTSGLGSTAQTNHYPDGSGDSPAWTQDTDQASAVTAHRYLTGLAGNLLADISTGATTGTQIQLVGLHGDVEATTTPTATLSPDGPSVDPDEYGNVRDTNGTTTTGPRYSWLGGKQRATDTGTTGLTLMGVRLYTPVTGRFLSTDPVYGGNDNTYGYPADPINSSDVTGRCPWCVGALALGAALDWNPIGWAITAVAVIGAVAYVGYQGFQAWERTQSQGIASSSKSTGKRYVSNAAGMTRTYCTTWRECKALAKKFKKTAERAGNKVSMKVGGRSDARYGFRRDIAVTVWRNGKVSAIRHFVLKGK
jgi:RHS repeat-associated protein